MTDQGTQRFVSGFEPGEGWHFGTENEVANGRDMLELHPADGTDSEIWFSDEPVRALPTTYWTVLSVRFASRRGAVLLLNESGEWINIKDGRPNTERIAGFEVLAVFQPALVKAVLDRVATTSMHDGEWSDGMRQVGREFGLK